MLNFDIFLFLSIKIRLELQKAVFGRIFEP
jgi:hypothetical protein